MLLILKMWLKCAHVVTVTVQELELDMVLGFRGFDCRSNLHYINDGADIVYHAAGAGVVLSLTTGKWHHVLLNWLFSCHSVVCNNCKVERKYISFLITYMYLYYGNSISTLRYQIDINNINSAFSAAELLPGSHR